jgi:hypothetical protein
VGFTDHFGIKGGIKGAVLPIIFDYENRPHEMQWDCLFA